MKAILNRVYKQPDTTMGIVEVHIKEKDMDVVICASVNERVEKTKEKTDIDLNLYSEKFRIIDEPEQRNGSIKTIENNCISDTYCEVIGEIANVDRLNDEVYVNVKCMGNMLHIICYKKGNLNLKPGDYLKAVCWTEIIEGKS